jgi:hypothetical protein
MEISLFRSLEHDIVIYRQSLMNTNPKILPVIRVLLFKMSYEIWQKLEVLESVAMTDTPFTTSNEVFQE